MSAGRIIKHGLAAVFPNLVLIRQRRAKHHIAITFDDGPDP